MITQQLTGRPLYLCLRPNSNGKGNKVYSCKVRLSTFIFYRSATYINVNMNANKGKKSNVIVITT